MFKKILAFFMTAVVTVSALTVTASAKSVKDYAKAAESGKKYSGTIVEKGNFKPTAYKIELSKKGQLKIDFSFEFDEPWFYLLDANKKYYNPDEITFKAGSLECCKESSFGDGSDGSGWGTQLCEGTKSGNTIGTVTFNDLEAGTYYFRLSHASAADLGSGKYSLTFTYSKSSDGDIDFTITMSVKSKITLGAVIGEKSAKAKWSSSNAKIASVNSSGKVTAKKKGTAIITAKSGNKTKTIKIIVE